MLVGRVEDGWRAQEPYPVVPERSRDRKYRVGCMRTLSVAWWGSGGVPTALSTALDAADIALFSTILIDFQWLSLISIGFHRFSLIFTVFHRFSVGFR